jgi:hypothetical protein
MAVRGALSPRAVQMPFLCADTTPYIASGDIVREFACHAVCDHDQNKDSGIERLLSLHLCHSCTTTSFFISSLQRKTPVQHTLAAVSEQASQVNLTCIGHATQPSRMHDMIFVDCRVTGGCEPNSCKTCTEDNSTTTSAQKQQLHRACKKLHYSNNNYTSNH